MAMKNVKFYLLACIALLSLAVMVGCQCSEDNDCFDGEWCNGTETCGGFSSGYLCLSGFPGPCVGEGLTCDEENDRCEGGCTTDDDCEDEDGLFCTKEVCHTGSGLCNLFERCPFGTVCDEVRKECILKEGPFLLAAETFYTFLHRIGPTPLPQPVGTLEVTSSTGDTLEDNNQFTQDGELNWVIVSDVPWLDFSSTSGTTPSEITIRFNGNINPVPQDLEDSFTVETEDGDQVITIEVTGDIQ